MPTQAEKNRNLNLSYALAALATLDETVDATPVIQEAINASGNGPIRFPDAARGTYRIDGMLVAMDDQGIDTTGVKLYRPADSTSTLPFIHLRGSRSCVVGRGTLLTEKAHPEGLILVGHRDNTSAWNTDNCLIRDVHLRGVQAAGNISAKFMSSQPWLGANYSSYFHTVDNVNIRGCDIGLFFSEKSNACKILVPNFWDCITAAVVFEGAYANQLIGGFVHTSTNGVVGVHLRNYVSPARPFSGHHAQANTILAFGVEPGGASGSLSRGVVIDSLCDKNYAEVMVNIDAGSTASNNVISNPNNTVLSRFGDQHFAADRTLKHVGTQVGRDSISHQGGGTIGEGQSADLISVTVNPDKAFLVEVDIDGINGTVGNMLGRAMYAVSNTGGTITALPLDPQFQGNSINLSWSSPAANTYKLTLNAISDGQTPVTTFQYSWKTTVRGAVGVPNVVKH